MARGSAVSDADPLLRLSDVAIDYRGLRPLRIRRLDVAEGQSIAVLGLDKAAGAVLVDLITGASLPDTGDVTVFGDSTRAIRDGRAWMRSLERFGLLGERTVLVDQLTAEENLAIPLTLVVDMLAPGLRSRVRRIGEEVGLAHGEMSSPAHALSPLSRFRVQVGRALMLEPRLLLAEHPLAGLAADDAAHATTMLSALVARRRLTSLWITVDRAFARGVATHVLAHKPGTGELTPESTWRRWWS